MRNYLIFTILLLSSSKLLSCGYSPYGEDIRYCLFSPSYFGYSQYKAFYYNADLFGFDYDATFDNRKPFYEANEIDWHNYVNQKVSLEAISVFMNSASFTDVHPDSDNEFLKYLYTNKKTKAIQYLTFAKRCEAINSLNVEGDVWERNKGVDKSKTNLFLNDLVKATKAETDTYFKRKYAFLGIRLAYYSGNFAIIRDFFQNHFKNSNKDYLYYWSSFFYAFANENPNRMNDVAALLEHSPEKYYASYYYFKNEFNLAEALEFAKTKEDIANLYGYASIQKVDRNLNYLKEMYKNNPKSKLLSFLLLREINKIEDWVYTPYYTNYMPSVVQTDNYWLGSEDNATTLTLRARSENDRLYAKEVLDFIQSVSISNTTDATLWRASEIQLLFITRKYEECLSKINQFESNYKSEKIVEQIEKIKALCITSNQDFGKAIIRPEIEQIIQKYAKDYRFMFALGRELEFRGNLTDGVALLSLCETSYDYEFGYIADVEWRGNRLANSNYMEVFYNYFDYLDFVYDANSLQKVIDVVPSKKTTDFQKFLYRKLADDLNYLKDLLGTKYIREEQLNKALLTFRDIEAKYWADNYNAWERGKYDENYAFDQNPFYKIKHTESFIDAKKSFFVNKLSVTEHLIKYLNLVNNPATKDKDYYYFLIANCYYNMSDKGNSWMMRRYSSYENYGVASYYNESYIDEREYRQNLKAKAFYTLAYKNAKTNKFKALCLRMIDYVDSNYPNNFGLLKKEFPQYHKELSSCANLNDYFKARR